MYCEDLSPYHYHGCPTGLPGTRSVGWLDRSVPFNTGSVSDQVLDAIRRFARNPIHLMRGVHHCEFCTGPATATGNGELWMRLSEGPVFVSPQLLPHYIDKHDYLPPSEFLAAINRQIESMPEEECDRMMREHMQRLNNGPSRDDILIELFEIQVYWQSDSFSDLLEFQKHLDWHQGPEPTLATSPLSHRSEGYCLDTVSRNPAATYADISRRFESSSCVPYMYRYRLVYLQESWTTVNP